MHVDTAVESESSFNLQDPFCICALPTMNDPVTDAMIVAAFRRYVAVFSDGVYFARSSGGLEEAVSRDQWVWAEDGSSLTIPGTDGTFHTVRVAKDGSDIICTCKNWKFGKHRDQKAKKTFKHVHVCRHVVGVEYLRMAQHMPRAVTLGVTQADRPSCDSLSVVFCDSSKLSHALNLLHSHGTGDTVKGRLVDGVVELSRGGTRVTYTLSGYGTNEFVMSAARAHCLLRELAPRQRDEPEVVIELRQDTVSVFGEQFMFTP